MSPQEAVQLISNGQIVQCSAAEYPAIRKALQRQAGLWIEQRQDARAQIALTEVQRLDAQFHYGLIQE